MSDKIRDMLASIKAQFEDLTNAIEVALPPATTNTIKLLQGQDLAGAIHALKDDGGTILLAPGDYSLNATLVERVSKTFITIKTDTANLPPDGKRITREYVSGLARLHSANGIDPILTAGHRSGNLACIGVAFMPLQFDRTMVDLGDDAFGLSKPEDRARDFLFDRCLWMGDPDRGQHRGLQVNALNVIVRGGGFYDCHEYKRDSQAICGWNGTENVQIHNTYLEGGAENVMFGGADSASAEMSPREITILGCLFRKSLKWKTLQFVPDIKCLFEIKNVRRFYMAGCIFEQNWRGNWASGVAISLKACNGGGNEPWATLEDVTIEDCIIRRVGSPFNVIGYNDGNKPGGTEWGKRVTLRHILCTELNQGEFQGDGRGIMLAKPPNQFTCDNVTMIGTSNTFANFDIEDPPGKASDFKMTDNVLTEGEYGLHSVNGLGKLALDSSLAPGYSFVGNAIRRGDRIIPYPPGNQVIELAPFNASINTDGTVKPGSAVALVTTTDGGPAGANLNRIKDRLADTL